ncbi:MAG: cysteine desulfurase, partial [Comamonas sp.]|nr:cysteine desulfurase [Comamonas sp.]
MVSAVSGLPEPSGAPISTELLAQLATALWAERPGAPAGLPPGVQAPVNIAPPGSPLASPAGLGPSVPGTPIPAGVLPGSNLLPASPMPALSLVHRAPALLPHAAAGNGVPDTLHSALPAYEPRLGGLVQGLPPLAAAPAAVPTTVPSAVPAAARGYYFLVAPAAATPGDAPLQALADQARHAAPDPHLDGIDLRGPRAADVPPLGQALQAPGAAPQYYFVHAVQLPNGFVTPAKAHPHADAAPVAAQQDRHPGFDIQAVRRDFPILSERINGKPLVWLDNAATTHKPRQVIERISHFYAP